MNKNVKFTKRIVKYSSAKPSNLTNYFKLQFLLKNLSNCTIHKLNRAKLSQFDKLFFKTAILLERLVKSSAKPSQFDKLFFPITHILILEIKKRAKQEQVMH